MKQLGLSYLVLGICFLGQSTRAADPASDLRAPMQLFQQGKFEDALDQLDRLYAQYKDAPAADFASVAMTRAQLIEQAALPTADNAYRKRLASVEDSYRAVMERGPAAQSWAARNNLAVLLIRLNRPQDAAKVFRDVQIANAQPSQRFICYYNFGRALELMENRGGALEQYLLSVKEPATFDLAAQAASRLIYADEAATKDQAIDLAHLLRQKGQLEAMAKHLHSGAEALVRAGMVSELMCELADYYLAANLSPAQFETAEWNGGIKPVVGSSTVTHLFAPDPKRWIGLSKLASQQPAAEPYARDLRAAYSSDFSSRPVMPAENFTVSKDPQFKPFLSRVLSKVADRSASEEPASAIGRYWAAWDLDWNNTDAAVRLAAILQDNKEVDRDGQIRSRFMNHLFSEKGGEYQKPAKTISDWQNIQRIHVALGSIFVAQNEWGHPGDEQWNPRTAAFQYAHAVKAEEELNKLEPKRMPSPGVFVLMGNCYVIFDQQDKAFDLYDRAASQYLKTFQDRSAAEEVILKLTALTVNPLQKQRASELQAELKTLPVIHREGLLNRDELQTLQLTPEQSKEIESADKPLRQKLADLKQRSVAVPRSTGPSISVPPELFSAEVQQVQNDRRQNLDKVLSPEQRSQLKKFPQTRPSSR